MPVAPKGIFRPVIVLRIQNTNFSVEINLHFFHLHHVKAVLAPQKARHHKKIVVLWWEKLNSEVKVSHSKEYSETAFIT